MVFQIKYYLLKFFINPNKNFLYYFNIAIINLHSNPFPLLNINCDTHM